MVTDTDPMPTVFSDEYAVAPGGVLLINAAGTELSVVIFAALKTAGIPAMVYYPKPMHLQTAFRCPIRSGMTDENATSANVMPGLTGHLCPVATSLCERVLSLPMHPYITTEEIDEVCTAVRKALA